MQSSMSSQVVANSCCCIVDVIDFTEIQELVSSRPDACLQPLVSLLFN